MVESLAVCREHNLLLTGDRGTFSTGPLVVMAACMDWAPGSQETLHAIRPGEEKHRDRKAVPIHACRLQLSTCSLCIEPWPSSKICDAWGWAPAGQPALMFALMSAQPDDGCVSNAQHRPYSQLVILLSSASMGTIWTLGTDSAAGGRRYSGSLLAGSALCKGTVGLNSVLHRQGARSPCGRN